MNIGIIGVGYVGLVTGACLSLNHNNNIICMDINSEIINDLKKNKINFYEPHLKEILQNSNNIKYTDNLKETIQNTEFCIISINTPQKNNGKCNLTYIQNAINNIKKCLNKDYTIIIKSTVPVGFANNIKKQFKNNKYKISIISNPEFLSEGNAIDNFLNQDRTIIGATNPKDFELIKKIYENISTKFICMNNNSAELVKLASNAYLATKISFINELANICEVLNADIHKVSEGIGADHRINPYFLKAGCGYGGSCFEKDINNLNYTSTVNGYSPKIIGSLNNINEKQQEILFNKINELYGEDLKNKTITIWGLSFKYGTDDIRCSPSINLVKKLLKQGCNINVHDKKALKNTYQIFKEQINYFDDENKSLKNSDCLIILTEDPSYTNKNILTNISETIPIFDCRNIICEQEKNNLYQYGRNML